MATIKLFDKQKQAFTSKAQTTVYAGGIQSGKTTCGALWMRKRFLDHLNPEDNFIVGAPTYKILSQSTLPKLLRLCGDIGRLHDSKGEFRIHGGGTAFIRTSTEQESIEGIPRVRGIWWDEAGMISRYFYENIQGRAAFMQAPVMLTTTPYSMNWLAKLCKDTSDGKELDTKVVQCRSVDSPYFPKEEYEKQKLRLNPRRFAMKYEGLFGKMEGLVYDRMDTVASFPLPPGTRYFCGVDWGYNPDPFVLSIRAVTPDGIHYRVAEFYRTFLTISDIARVCQRYRSIYGIEMFYCDPSQPANIQELNNCGCPAVGANNEIRYGIDKHYELMATGRFFVFEDMNPYGIDEYNSYHYPEEKELAFDKDSKETLPVDRDNHGCDADRYATVEIEQAVSHMHRVVVPGGNRRATPPRDNMRRLQWLKRGGTGNKSNF